PNTDPQMEKKNMATGMIIQDLLLRFLISLPMPASMAFVSFTTAIAPPTINIKKMICAVSCSPRGTAVRNCSSVTGVDSTYENESGFTTSLSCPVSGLSTIVIISYVPRSEEHTSELQSRFDLVCRLLLEKK